MLVLKDIGWAWWSHIGGDDFVTETADFYWPVTLAPDVFITSALTLVIDPAVQPAVAAAAAGIISLTSVAGGTPSKESFGGDAWQWQSALYRPGLMDLSLGVVTSAHRATGGLFTLYFF
jgi:hypothetical protein